ncbi:MAG: hypothetical protein ACOC3J_03625 [Gemmatimonadota bacterium]
MPLDFRSATELFVSTEEELALALGLPVADLRSYRQKPETAPTEVVHKLGQVLIERGRGMARVGEMLQEQ